MMNQNTQQYFPGDLREISVCFTGHRFIPTIDIPKIRSLLTLTIMDLYNKGYRHFYCGGALGFDTLAAEAVLALRKEHSDVVLHIAVPCVTQSDLWSETDQKRYRLILDKADYVHIMSEFYYRGCMEIRNRFMVDHSSLCVCWLLRFNRSGTMSTVKYAARQDIPVINLALLSGKEK